MGENYRSHKYPPQKGRLVFSNPSFCFVPLVSPEAPGHDGSLFLVTFPAKANWAIKPLSCSSRKHLLAKLSSCSPKGGESLVQRLQDHQV